MSDEQVSELAPYPPRVMVNRRVGSNDEGWSNEWMPATPTELLAALSWHIDHFRDMAVAAALTGDTE